MDDRDFPPDFFKRRDPATDAEFYAPMRLVTHIDEAAIEAVGTLYEELGIGGEVLDLMGSWVSHFRTPPAAADRPRHERRGARGEPGRR